MMRGCCFGAFRVRLGASANELARRGACAPDLAREIGVTADSVAFGLGRATHWGEMARGKQKIGTVRSRPGKNGPRWFIDFGKKVDPRHLYSFRGIRFDNEGMAVGMLGHIQMEIANGRDLADVLSEFDPHADKRAGEWLPFDGYGGAPRPWRTGGYRHRTEPATQEWRAV